MIKKTLLAISIFALNFSASTARADGCKALPSYDQLKAALSAAKAESNGGLGTNMWGAVVDRDGIVCAVVMTGKERGDQWPGSRLISVEKAVTSNAFSLDSLALSTANIYAASQPGGPLFGIALSAAPNIDTAYAGKPASFGQKDDPLVGHVLGGGIVFGGGLALYSADHKILGGLGVSGDTSCADHNIAWRTRHNLKLDFVSAGVSADKTRPDNIVYDIPKSGGASASGWGHPACNAEVAGVAENLPAVSK